MKIAVIVTFVVWQRGLAVSRKFVPLAFVLMVTNGGQIVHAGSATSADGAFCVRLAHTRIGTVKPLVIAPGASMRRPTISGRPNSPSTTPPDRRTPKFP